MSFDDYSQHPFSPPTLPTLPYFDDFENPQHIYEYPPTQYSTSTTPSPQSSFDTTIQSSPTPESSTSTDNNLFGIEPAGSINTCQMLILEPSTLVLQTS